LQRGFFKVDIGSLTPNRSISLGEESHVSLEGYSFVLEARASSRLFPYTFELVFERNTSFKSSFSIWGRAQFV
jgi:hypothetical protein